jgi:hypothetical protein
LSGSCPALRFTVDGREIRTNLLTVFLDIPCNKVKNDTKVTVTSVLQSAGWALATIVQKGEQ